MNIFESSESRRPGTFIGKKLEKDSRSREGETRKSLAFTSIEFSQFFRFAYLGGNYTRRKKTSLGEYKLGK